MKLITAIIQRSQLAEIETSLTRAGITDIVLTDVHGYGRQNGYTEPYTTAAYYLDFVPKLRVDALVDDHAVDEVTKIIVDAVHTGRIGDGKLWITTVDTLIHLPNNEPPDSRLNRTLVAST